MFGLIQYVTIDFTLHEETFSVDARNRLVVAEKSQIYLEDCEYHKGYCELQDKTFIWRVGGQVCMPSRVLLRSSNYLLLYSLLRFVPTTSSLVK